MCCDLFKLLFFAHPRVSLREDNAKPKSRNLGIVLEFDPWSLALVQHLALVNPRHSTGGLWLRGRGRVRG
jgi:hypothetical protein